LGTITQRQDINSAPRFLTIFAGTQRWQRFEAEYDAKRCVLGVPAGRGYGLLK
jgi:hypothetical protein